MMKIILFMNLRQNNHISAKIQMKYLLLNIMQDKVDGRFYELWQFNITLI